MGLGDFLDKTKIGGVPMLGTIINGAKAVTHLGEAGIDAIAGDKENEHDHLAMATLDGFKAIPGAGTAVTAGEWMYDMHAGRPTEEHLYDPKAPARQQTLLQDVREWEFGRRADGKETGRDTRGAW